MTPTEFIEWYNKKFKLTFNFPTRKKDQEALITLIEKYNIKSIFEIGTWKGDTSMLLWLHPNIERLKTIDINIFMDTIYSHSSHNLMSPEDYGIMFKNTPIEMEFCDSLQYEPKKDEQYDMIFIDGNHDYKHVLSDTNLAIKLHPKIIVWHDYEKSNKDVVIFINKLKSEQKVKIQTYEGSIVVWGEINYDNSS